MNDIEQAVMESRIETAENRIRSQHNELEAQKIFGHKTYLPYRSDKFIAMIVLMESVLKEHLCPSH